MSLSTGTLTAEQLAARPDDGKRYELIDGELRMMSPAGGQHGRVAFKLGLLLGNHVFEHELGRRITFGDSDHLPPNSPEMK